MKVNTLDEAFKAFKAKKWDHYKTWSAINEDGFAVLTLWKDLIYTDFENKFRIWDCFNQPNWWHQEIGNKMRINHISHALENHNGFFTAIELFVVDKDAAPREIDKQKGIYPKKDQWWAIDKFDSSTGEFRAIQNWNRPEIFLTTDYDANLHNNKL